MLGRPHCRSIKRSSWRSNNRQHRRGTIAARCCQHPLLHTRMSTKKMMSSLLCAVRCRLSIARLSAVSLSIAPLTVGLPLLPHSVRSPC